MQSNKENTKGLLEIKRYSNRRFYDSTRSQHVTQDDLYRLIQDGYQIRVTDTQTGKDITSRVLTQLIIDTESSKINVFPTELLHGIIRAHESLSNDFAENYFSHAFDWFLETRRKMDHQMKEALKMKPMRNPMTDWMQSMWGDLAPQQSTPTPQAKDNAESNDDYGDLIRDLHSKIEELQEELSHIKTPKRRKSKP
jgi:polyhydroxyalkanoate synthesis repressor PhaR